MNLSIETYKEGDKEVVLDGLVALQSIEVPLSETRAPATREGAMQYLQTLLANVSENNGVFLCAHQNDALLGFVVCWVEREENSNETPDSTTYGYISDAFVFEEYRGQGVFKALNSAAEKHLRSLPDIRRVRLNVLATNILALTAYRHVGYHDYEIMLEKKL